MHAELKLVGQTLESVPINNDPPHLQRFIIQPQRIGTDSKTNVSPMLGLVLLTVLGGCVILAVFLTELLPRQTSAQPSKQQRACRMEGRKERKLLQNGGKKGEEIRAVI